MGTGVTSSLLSPDFLLVDFPSDCVAARILRYSHTWVCSVPRCSRALRIKQNPAQIFIPTPALCVGFLYYCFTRSENFLVFSVNLRNCILTLHFSWISEPTKFWKNTLVIYLDFVFVVNLLIHNLILYSVFKVHLASHLLWLVVENKGFEPLTPCVQGRCSPSWANSPYTCLLPASLCCCSFVCRLHT